MDIKEQKLRRLIRQHIKKQLNESQMSAQYGDSLEQIRDIFENQFKSDVSSFLSMIGDLIGEYDVSTGEAINKLTKSKNNNDSNDRRFDSHYWR